MEAIRYVSPEETTLDLDRSPRSDRTALRAVVSGVALPSHPDNHVARGRRRLNVLRTSVDMASGDEVLSALRTAPSLRPRHLCYVNAHSLNLAYRDNEYHGVLSRADLVLNDGIGLQIAARMQGKRFSENLNGSDFTLRLLHLSAHEGWSVYLYGGQPGVAEAARDRLCASIDGLNIVGACHGYMREPDEAIARRIRRAGADVVIVALGQPAQELWLDNHLASTGCHLGLGVGAFLDFVSGRVVRAPGWMNRFGIEWMFRLVNEPGRLWRRYIVGNPVFLWRAWSLRMVDFD
jgi:exopolysaccharide biosynthesis WecB/TagA/CpsF family protein